MLLVLLLLLLLLLSLPLLQVLLLATPPLLSVPQTHKHTFPHTHSLTHYLFPVAPSCTSRAASPRSPPAVRGPPDTPSARPTCPFCSARTDHCSRPSGRLPCVGFLRVSFLVVDGCFFFVVDHFGLAILFGSSIGRGVKEGR